MSNHKLSEISIEYSLHINQIQKAREIFERDCNGFMNDVSCYLDKKFTSLYEKDCKLYLEIGEGIKIAPSGHAKSYYSICKYPIKMKRSKAKSARYDNVGYFQTGIEFDNSLQAFIWMIMFHNNEEILDPQLDERMISKIREFSQEDQSILFNNFEQINFDGLYFQKMLIDDKCNLDLKAPLDASVKILLSTIAESENFIKILGKSEYNKVMKIAG